MIRLANTQSAFWALVLSSAVLYPAAAAAQASPGNNIDALQPGDAVRITVWQKPEMSGEFVVAADGTVADPFYMTVNVAGVPYATAVQRIREHVERYERTNMVLVEPLVRVSVGGEVRQPNLVMARPETTIAQVIMMAGGPTDRANLGKVKVYRTNQQMSVDLGRPSEAHVRFVESGDLIVVPRSKSVLRDQIGPLASLAAALASISFWIRRSI